MNITLPTRPPSTTSTAADILQSRAPRTALTDRIAMRIGLALLIWGTRPVTRRAPDVSGYRNAASQRDAARDIDRTLAAYQNPHPPFSR